jgi:hypothetical protein
MTMKYCAVALYDSEKSVTLVSSDTAFTARQIADFQYSSAPPEKDAAGKERTSIHFAFCPGGGKSQPIPSAVKLVELSVTVGGLAVSRIPVVAVVLGSLSSALLPPDQAPAP